MKKYFLIIVSAITLLCGSFALLFGWGAWGHQHINHAAVFALPPEMRVFFFNHIDFITEESVIPDKRKYTLSYREEGPRHFMDVEAYGNQAFETLPPDWKEAQGQFGYKMLDKNGILPWFTLEMYHKLVIAFKEKDKDNILFIAADLAHYLGDATQPLHTTTNFDGQFTGQKGIHAFFESQLPELFGNSFNFYTGNAEYIADPRKEIWNMIRESHALVDTVLLAETAVAKKFPEDKKYLLDSAGNIIKNKYGQPIHTLAYARAYQEALHGLVERQIRLAISETADFWYTAWVDAGKPDLNRLDPAAVTKRNRKFLRQEYKLWQKGKLFGFKAENEF